MVVHNTGRRASTSRSNTPRSVSSQSQKRTDASAAAPSRRLNTSDYDANYDANYDPDSSPTSNYRRNSQRNSRRNSSGSGTRKERSLNYTRQQRRRTWRGRHPILFWMLIAILVPPLLGALVFAYMYATTDIPAPDKVAMADKTKVYYADGKTELGSFAEQNREIINCSVLPDYVGKAIVASENRSFYHDGGIDFKGIGRALIHNVTKRGRWGGSTITQQYAERYYLGETKSYLGKLHEAVLALKIAQTQDKNTVLCNYMNTIYLGRGAYGIQAAAKAYFGVEAKDLTLPQAALLAGIIPAPSSWDPAIGPKEAGIRFKRVLRIMKQDGYITAAQAASATLPKTIVQTAQNVYAGPQGYLLHMVRDELTRNGAFTQEDLDSGGYRVITTIDKAKQDLMFHVASPSQGGRGIVPEGLQVGGISINAKDGSIISVYAGDDYLKKQLNNATQALYEPGSTMKPFALLGAIQAGTSLNTQFNGNSPRKFDGIDTPVGNFSNRSFGMVNLYSATANSVNTVYMDLQQKLGARSVAHIAVTAGLSPKRVDGKNPFTVLGNDPVHVSEIARAYATFANQGKRPELHIVASVKNPDGKEFYRAPTAGKQVFSPTDTALATQAMIGVVQHGTAAEARAVGRPIAGKSGTANDMTAGSFVGYTPNVVTAFAIWNPDANGSPQVIKPFHGYFGGGDYPVHMFTRYMKQALAGTPVVKFPEVKDNGKIGGQDGTWGLGEPRTYEHSDSSEDADNKRKSEGEPHADGPSSSDNTALDGSNGGSDNSSSAGGGSSAGGETGQSGTDRSSYSSDRR